MGLKLCEDCRKANRKYEGQQVYITFKAIDRSKRDAEILTLRKEGKEFGDLASRFKLSKTHIRMICKKGGVK